MKLTPSAFSQKLLSPIFFGEFKVVGLQIIANFLRAFLASGQNRQMAFSHVCNQFRAPSVFGFFCNTSSSVS